MKRLAFLAAITLLPTSLLASDLTVSQQFSRATSPAMKNGAVFMVIKNGSNEDRTLVQASTDVAARVELHTHLMDDEGVMRMREVAGGIDVPAGMKNVLRPGSYHIMMMGLKGALKRGSEFDVTLTFDNGDTLDVNVPVKSAGEMMPMSVMDDTLHGSTNKTGSGAK